MKKVLTMIAMAAAVLTTGCSHNVSTVVCGKGFILSAQGVQYFNGVALVDASRENSRVKIELTDDDALAQEGGTAAVKNVRSIERSIDKQVTGYVTELAEKDPEAARTWLGGAAQAGDGEPAKQEQEADEEAK